MPESVLIFIIMMAVTTVLAATGARFHDKRGTLSGPTRERRLTRSAVGSQIASGEATGARRTAKTWNARAMTGPSSRWP
jgi:hypothetical protein